LYTAYYNEYAAAVARQAADAAVRLAEQQASRLLIAKSAAAGEAASVESVIRTSSTDAREVAGEPARAAAAMPIATAAENSTIPASHNLAPAPEWDAEFLAKQDGEETAGRTMTAAVAGWEAHGPYFEPGRLVTGTMGPDVDALDQDVSRFFTQLGTQGMQLLTWSNLVDFSSWLAGGIAVAGALELARRSGRTRTRLAGGQGAPFDGHLNTDDL
jgi:hypothetical protein